MKKKTQSYATLKTKLDKIFSEWIRRKDSNSEGMNSCVTCGTKKHWKELQAGHFVSRVHLSTRWTETNVNPQCSACNVLRRGNMVEYAVWMNENYGWAVIEDLRDLKNKTVKYSRADLQDLIAQFSQKIEAL